MGSNEVGANAGGGGDQGWGAGLHPAAGAVFNPFADPAVAARYHAWYRTTGRHAARCERDLLRWVLERFPGANTVLEVGCGTGEFTRWFRSHGCRTMGVDASLSMLTEARRLGSPDCVCGAAEALPFADNSFDLVALITTVEFVKAPVVALAEAVRVARRGLVLGVINRRSTLGRRYGRAGGVWRRAHLLDPAELRRLVVAAAGRGVSVAYRTTLWPGWRRSLPLPWGGFIGMAVAL